MNRIELKDLKNLSNIDNKLVITFLKDTNLLIDDNENNEYEFNIKENINVDIFIINRKTYNNIYTYNLEKNSNLNVLVFNDSESVLDKTIINLNGEYANANYNLKTIANDKQNYDIYINHNSSKTISNIKNNGVSINGEISFNIECKIDNDIKGCEANQSSRIITLKDKKCTIKPNLLISEEDVVANHSALIGTFSDDEIFYLESRGINYNNAIKLLIKGFLYIDEEIINEILDKYWR